MKTKALTRQGVKADCRERFFKENKRVITNILWCNGSRNLREFQMAEKLKWRCGLR